MESLQPATGRALRLALAGVILAVAWVLVSVVLGLGGDHANADESDDRSGLLGALSQTAGSLVTAATDVVDDATSAATLLVNDTASASTAAVTPVIETVTVVAPGLPVAPVVEVAESVTSAVAGVAAGGVLEPTVTSTVGLVRAVPVAGSLASALHLDTAALRLGTSVDHTLRGSTSALSGVLAGVAAAAPGGISIPVIPVPSAPNLHDPDPNANVAGSDAALPALSVVRALFAAAAAGVALLTSGLIVDSVSGVSTDPASPGGIPADLLRSLMPADVIVTGSSGAGPGGWMLLAFGPFIAYRAWMRRGGIGNDTAPAAPVLSTDVSPD